MLQLLLNLKTIAGHRRGEDEGATAVEYGLMIAFIAMALILVAAALGDNVSQLFDDANTQVVNNGSNDANTVDTPAAP